MIQRARSLLGTIVAIRADAADLDGAFAAVERVHRLMSFHSPVGDVARINAQACRAAVKVHPWTFRVLTHALQVSLQTDGAFDVTAPGSGARYTDIVLEDRCRVRLRRPARIDLGGIAKGFAVDMAIEALRRAGASSASVNAGGDLRFFGHSCAPLRVRLPSAPKVSVCLPRVRHQAFATSGSYFGSRLNDPHTGRESALEWSVTVGAASCMVADALTKAVALLGPVAALLRAFDATAFAVDRHGQLYAAAG